MWQNVIIRKMKWRLNIFTLIYSYPKKIQQIHFTCFSTLILEKLKMQNAMRVTRIYHCCSSSLFQINKIVIVCVHTVAKLSINNPFFTLHFKWKIFSVCVGKLHSKEKFTHDTHQKAQQTLKDIFKFQLDQSLWPVLWKNIITFLFSFQRWPKKPFHFLSIQWEK